MQKQSRSASFKKLCSSCNSQGCCTNSAVPLVFANDYENLKAKDKENNNFLKEIDIDGKKIKAVRKKKNSDICIFWDEFRNNCSIYENRPFDCKAYPFDICNIDGKYRWIVYSCNPHSNWDWSESFLQMLENDQGFYDIIQNMDTFAKHTKMILPSESKKTSYTVLREVRMTK
jgi:hypothetical protein